MENFQKHNTTASAQLEILRPTILRGNTALQQAPNYYDAEAIQPEAPDALSRYWNIFRRHKWAILCLSAISAFIAILLGLAMPAYYRAHAQVEVLSLNENILNTKETASVTSDDYETSEVETQAKILQNSTLHDVVLERLAPAKGKESANSAKPVLTSVAPANGWQLFFRKSKPTYSSPERLLYIAALKSVKVKPALKTRLIDITADSRNPQVSADLVNGLIKAFIDENVDARWKAAANTNKWLGNELEDARKNLLKGEDALQDYSRKSGLIFTDADESNIATEKLQQIQSEFASVTNDRIAKQARYELAQSSPPDSLPDVLNDESLRNAWLKLVDLRRNVADLSTVYESYGKLNRAKAELASVETSFEHTKSDILTRISNDYHEALRKEKLLKAEYGTQASEVTSQGEKSVQYNILKRDVDSSRQLYDTMLQQLKASSIAAAVGASNIRVVEAAEPSSYPWWPSFPILGALGFILGCFGSLLTFVIRENADRTVQNPGDLATWTSLPELGIIPRSTQNRRNQKSRIYGKAVTYAAASLAPPTTKTLMPALTDGLLLEAFRSATTSILFNRDGLKQSGTLVITSAQAAEGKTTCACSLALAMAEVKNGVLLIDADLRRPQVHKIFDLNIDSGLADILRSRGELNDLFTNGYIKNTSVPGLDVITAGANSHGLANLLYSDHFEEMLTQLKQRYAVIIIDTPPMLHLNDARVVARLADSVILIVRSQKTTRDAVVAASQKFASDGNPLMGIILNDWDLQRSGGGYYGYRADSYYANYDVPVKG